MKTNHSFQYADSPTISKLFHLRMVNRAWFTSFEKTAPGMAVPKLDSGRECIWNDPSSLLIDPELRNKIIYFLSKPIQFILNLDYTLYCIQDYTFNSN